MLWKYRIKLFKANTFPILGGFFVNNVGWQSNHFCKTDNKAKWYEKSKIFNLWQVRKRLFWKVVCNTTFARKPTYRKFICLIRFYKRVQTCLNIMIGSDRILQTCPDLFMILWYNLIRFYNMSRLVTILWYNLIQF